MQSDTTIADSSADREPKTDFFCIVNRIGSVAGRCMASFIELRQILFYTIMHLLVYPGIGDLAQ